jgi:hypothetical protein
MATTPTAASTPDLAAKALPPTAALPTTDSLPAAARAAAAQGQPLVVMTTLKGCPFCDVARNNYLGPMLRQGQVVAIQLDMTDRTSALTGFDGKPTTPAAQVTAWKARLAPTVLFLGTDGRELAERLRGVAVQDMFGAYLDMRLSESRKLLSGQPR